MTTEIRSEPCDLVDDEPEPASRPPKIRVRRLDIADRGANRWEYSVNGLAKGRARTEASAYARANLFVVMMAANEARE